MLNKKITVQKGFRIDCFMAQDLETLSEILERPQNDLVSVAIQELLEKNRSWFKLNVFVDLMSKFFEGNADEAQCKIGGIEVQILAESEAQARISYSFADNEGHIHHEKVLVSNADDGESAKRKLREIASQFFWNDEKIPEIEKYLSNLFNYK